MYSNVCHCVTHIFSFNEFILLHEFSMYVSGDGPTDQIILGNNRALDAESFTLYHSLSLSLISLVRKVSFCEHRLFSFMFTLSFCEHFLSIVSCTSRGLLELLKN